MAEEHAGESLRRWASGGPEGASWNWFGYDLVCRVALRGGCDTKAVVRLYAGGREGAKATIELAASAERHQDVRLPAAVWQKSLESDPAALYQSLLLVVRVEARCPADDGPPGPASYWVDGFVAGFAGGE